MSGMAKVLGSGAKRAHQFIFDEQIYNLRPIDWDMKEELELNLYERKMAALEPQRRATDAEAYQFKLDELTARYENNEFSLDSEEGQKYYLGEASLPTTDEDEKLMTTLEQTCKVVTSREGKLSVSPQPPAEVQAIIDAHAEGLANIIENRRRRMKQLPGLLFFASRIFGCDRMTMVRMLKQKPIEVGNLLSLVVRENMLTEPPGQKAENRDPNS